MSHHHEPGSRPETCDWCATFLAEGGVRTGDEINVERLARAIGVVETTTNTRLLWMDKSGAGDLAYRHLAEVAREYAALTPDPKEEDDTELEAYAAGWSPARHGGGASWEPGAGTFVGPDEKEVQ